jgi:hypothetical protein
MADINLKTETPDTSLPSDGFLFGADSQAAASPSVYTTQAVATTLLGSTTLSGTTITANAPVLNLSQTWNNAAVTFTGLQFNATDTASNAASLLLDLQVGGASRFKIQKNGQGTFAGQTRTCFIGGAYDGLAAGSSAVGYSIDGIIAGLAGIAFSSGSLDNRDLFLTRRGERNLRLGAADAATALAQTFSVQSVVAGTTNGAGANFTITGSQGTGSGVGGSIIFQVAPAGGSGTGQNALQTVLQITGAGGLTGQDGATANTLALRNGTAAQAFRVYNTFTDASNYERGYLEWIGNVLYFGTTAAGSGSRRRLSLSADSMEFVTGAGSGTVRWQINSSGNFIAGADNTYDIGAVAATRPRDVYVAGTVSPGRGVTVAGLPTPSTGMMARVTDATAPVVGSTVVGGGAAAALVWYNGANWTVIGV